MGIPQLKGGSLLEEHQKYICRFRTLLMLRGVEVTPDLNSQKGGNEGKGIMRMR